MDFFTPFLVPLSRRKPTTRRSIIPALYTPSARHSIVKEALYTWRQQQALEHLGEGMVRRLGAHLLMSEEVIERLLACWTYGKISDVSHLRKETIWAQEWISLCGQSVVDLLAKYQPRETTIPSPSINIAHRNPFPFTDTSELSHSIASHLPRVASRRRSDDTKPSDPLTPTPTLSPRHINTLPALVAHSIPIHVPPVEEPKPQVSQALGHIPRRLNRVKRCGQCHEEGHNRKIQQE
jgi:hypothetical protein